jgi:hypothetical protein
MIRILPLKAFASCQTALANHNPIVLTIDGFATKLRVLSIGKRGVSCQIFSQRLA